MYALNSVAPRRERKIEDQHPSGRMGIDDQPRLSVRHVPPKVIVNQFPRDVLSVDHATGLHNESGGCAWWLAHTRPRQEKAIAAELHAREVGFYLPLVNRKSLTRGRTRMASIPLFPSYIFIFGNEKDRLSALKTNRLVTLRKVIDGEQLRSQLSKLAMLIAAGMPLVREARLVGGERVRIKAGPFCDTEGVVLRRNGKIELLIAVDFLQQGAALEIDDCMLELV